MNMIDANLLLPSEFTKAIPQPMPLEDPLDDLRAVIRKQNRRRHPDLITMNPHVYRMPVTTALFLYRRNPEDHRETALAALGTPRSTLFGSLLSAAARDAVEQRDWILLGRLAWRLESGAMTCTRGGLDTLKTDLATPPESTDLGRRWTVTPGRLKAAFLRLLDYPGGKIDAHAYVTVALSYFLSLPEGFVFPADWWVGTSSQKLDDNQWTILRLLCRRNASAWQTVPAAFEQARQLKHAFLPLVLHDLQRQSGPQPDHIVPLANPFQKLAGAVGEEPAHGKLSQLVRKMTGRAARMEPTASHQEDLVPED